MAKNDMDVIEVTTPTGKHYQVRILPDKPIVVHPIIFGRVDAPLPMGSDEWIEASDAHKTLDQEPERGLIGEMRCKGKTHRVFKADARFYNIFVDGVLTQRNLTPDDFVRWGCNALEDGS